MEKKGSIHELFENHAHQHPDHIAIQDDSTSITYRELNEKSNQLAHYLTSLGVQSETTIAVCLERNFSLLVAILAILKANGAYVPLDPSHPFHRLEFTLKDNHDPIIITSFSYKKRFSKTKSHLLVLEDVEERLASQPKINLNLPILEHQLAYIIYTSGSTGNPKGVMIEHQSVLNYALFFQQYSKCEPQHRIDFSSNIVFDMAVTSSIVPLMLGLTVIPCPDEVKKNLDAYLHYLAKHNVNFIKITPSYFKTLIHAVQHQFIDLHQVVALILGGENLSANDCALWLELYPEHLIFNEYGPTETTVAVSIHQVSYDDLKQPTNFIPIGLPAPNVEWHLLKKDNSSDLGELYIGGICLARGYLNQPELTSQKFLQTSLSQNTLYKTGDLCRQLENGELLYVGRIDFQIKIRGHRVEPHEIEQTILTLKSIQDVTVLARKEAHEEKLVAYYVLKDDATPPSLHDLQSLIKANLPDYMMPQAFVRLNAFPLTPNGKLDKAALPIPKYSTNQHYHPPTTSLEKTLAKLWANELDIKLVGIEDNFFELGGHSLSASRIMSQIHHELAKNISIVDFYKAATIKKLAIFLSKTNPISPTNTHIPAEVQELSDLPLSDFQLLLWLSTTFAPKAKKINIISRKRVRGKIDPVALNHAFKAVLKKHEALFWTIEHLRPLQHIGKNLKFEMSEIDLSHENEKTVESILDQSIQDLFHYYPWKKNQTRLKAQLFHLPKDETELQFAMPHMISDDVSSEILLSDLSEFYLLSKQDALNEDIKVDYRYRQYHLNQQFSANLRANHDLSFWENYLKDTSLLAFPAEFSVKNMKSRPWSYSTYFKIPEQDLLAFRNFCANHEISLHDGLCAALGLTLAELDLPLAMNANTILMNMVKSTRTHHQYDDTIGCFLHNEPIKISIDPATSIINLAHQIHQETIETAPYQRSSSLIKFASVSTFRKKRALLKQSFLVPLLYLYTLILPTPYLDRKILQMSQRLMQSKKSNQFLLNVNVQKSMLSDFKKHHAPEWLFGLKTKKIKMKHHDLLALKNVFDVCFFRDEVLHEPFVVISASLTPTFREQIGKLLLEVIHQAPKITRSQAPILDLQSTS